jgi:HlyD family secretion protein
MQLASDPGFVSVMDRPVKRRRITRPMLVGATVVVASLAGLSWWVMHPAGRVLTIEPSKVTISTVRTAPFHDFIPLRGQVVPLDSIVLDAVQGGRVEQVLAEAGERVAAGQPLIRLSDPQLELDAIAREAQVIQQIDDQQAQQLSFEITRTNDAKAIVDADYNIQRLSRQVARRQPLAAKGFASQETLDQPVDELNWQRQLRAIAVDALQRDADVIERGNALIERTGARLDANLAAARRQLETLTLRAPAEGVLTGLEAHVGQELVRGQHLGQIDRDSGFKVTVLVDEFYLARVKQGLPVAVTVDGAPGTLIVSKIYPQVKNGQFEVDLTWEGAKPGDLRRGEAVQGKLELGGDVPAVLLPAGPFLEASGGAWVFVVDPGGSFAVRRAVKLGRRTSESVEVVEGLKPGERVITSDYTGLDRIDRILLSS